MKYLFDTHVYYHIDTYMPNNYPLPYKISCRDANTHQYTRNVFYANKNRMHTFYLSNHRKTIFTKNNRKNKRLLWMTFHYTLDDGYISTTCRIQRLFSC